MQHHGEGVTPALFKPLSGTIGAHLFGNPLIGLPIKLFYQIEIPLAPFVFGGKEQRTAVRTDFIRFPVREWRQLVNHDFRFPINPEEGYIDGSIYLGHAHNPADVTRIAFGGLHGDLISARFNISFDFTIEGAASELGVFAVDWTVQLQCSAADLDAVTLEADRVGAER